MDREGIESAKEILTIARKGGINFFDNAESYGKPPGAAEQIFGQAYKELREEDPVLWRRSEIVLTTKLFWGGYGVNERGLSRKHIMEAMEASLARLQVDYVDVIYCHRSDKLMPTENVVRAMTDLVRQNKATAWATSEWSAQQITEAFWIARSMGLEPPQVEQSQYHMFDRERIEKEYYPIYKAPYGIGLTVYSPLACGLLTGKYSDGTLPEGSRAKQTGFTWLEGVIQKWEAEGKLSKVKELTAYAKEKFDCTTADLALAWCATNPNVSCVLLGATKPEQIVANLKAVEVAKKMTPSDMAAIEAILGNKPADYWALASRAVPASWKQK